MAKQPRVMPSMGLLLLIIGIIAIFVKSGQGELLQTLLGSAIFLLCAGYFAIRSLQGDESWWMVLLAGLCMTMALILVVRHFNLVKAGMLWVIFFSGASLTLHLLWKYRPHPARDGWLSGGSYLMAALALYQYAKTIHLLDSLTLAALLFLAGGVWLLLRKK